MTQNNNSAGNTSDNNAANIAANAAPRIILTPLKSALIAGHAQRVQVLVRIQAPDVNPTYPAEINQRPPYHLALVIDRSGSMSGEPLHEAKRCARHIIDQLKPDDRASLVQFDNRVQILVPAQPVADRTALHRALQIIEEGGTTNLHGGWEAGGQSLLEYIQQVGLSRVILLSDGNANVGLTEPERIIQQCAQFADRGVTTSTSGLGSGFNEDLMVAMAKAGQGNHYYGATAQDLFEPFAEEFDLIANLYAGKVRLTLGTPEGVKARLLNDYVVEDQRGFPVIRLPDLAWGAEAWAMLELEVPLSRIGDAPSPLLQLEINATGLQGQLIVFPPAQLKLPTLPAQAWEALLPDPLVLQRLNELEAGKLLEKARTAAQHGDWNRIERLLAEAKQRFADNPWVQEVMNSMAELARQQDQAHFAKEARYSSRRMNTRLAAKEEPLAMLGEAEAPAFLRRKSAQGKTQYRDGKDGNKPDSL
jgi:Ca-activated chloride channel family protein